MSDYDPIERSTDLDGHGLAPAVEPDRCAQSGGHGMEEVRGSSPLSSTLHQYGSRKVEHRQPLANLAGVIRTPPRCLFPRVCPQRFRRSNPVRSAAVPRWWR